MVKQKKETKTERKTVEVETETKSGKLKKSTIVTGVLLLGAAAVWGVLGYQAMSRDTGESLFGKYFHEDKNDVVVATIDGKNVYLSQIKAVADQIPQLADLPFDMIYPQLLQKYLTKEVIYKSAQESNVQKEPSVQLALKEAHDTIISKAYLEKKIEELATPQKLKELYDSETKTMERSDEVHARHILVQTEKEANDILVQLEAGADFQMLANTKSLDAENGNGGDLGYFQKNMMIPEFGEAVFALKKGQISKPIKTPFGWHIVLVEDRRVAPLPPFESVQEQLRQIFVERNLQDILHQEEVKHDVKVLVPSLTTSQPSATEDALQQMQNEVAEELAAEDAATQAADKALKPEAAPAQAEPKADVKPVAPAPAPKADAKPAAPAK